MEKSHVELLEENEKLRQELYNAQTALKKVNIIARTHKPPVRISIECLADESDE